MNMNLFVFIAFCTFCANATAQYYYQNQPAVYYNPPTYNAFSHPFSTYQVNPQFQYFRSEPQQFRQFSPVAQQFRQFSPVPQQFRPVPPPTPPPTQVYRSSFAHNEDSEYRGFAYQTQTDNGATSHVLFVTGPQAQQVNSRVFNNFNSPVFGANPEVNLARTVASEMVDTVKKTEQEEEKENVLPKSIQDIYAPPPMLKVDSNVDIFQRFFPNMQNSSTGLINFYSRNNDLFAEQVPGYPANVVPLRIDYSRNSTQLNVEQSDRVPAESILTATHTQNTIDQTLIKNRFKQTESEMETEYLTPTTEILPSSTISASISVPDSLNESPSTSESEISRLSMISSTTESEHLMQPNSNEVTTVKDLTSEVTPTEPFSEQVILNESNSGFRTLRILEESKSNAAITPSRTPCSGSASNLNSVAKLCSSVTTNQSDLKEETTTNAPITTTNEDTITTEQVTSYLKTNENFVSLTTTTSLAEDQTKTEVTSPMPENSTNGNMTENILTTDSMMTTISK